MSFTSFPSIEGLHNVVKLYEVYPYFFPETLTYRGKPKLHGVNAGVRITDAGPVAQSRTRDIPINDDPDGFARWAESRKDYFSSLPGSGYTIFGEWCGPGIMRGTSLSLIPNKIFAVFMIQYGASDDEESTVVFDPEEITKLLGDRPSDVYVLPYWGQPLTISYADRATLELAAEIANAEIAIFEVCDPWVKETFGVEGNGEGVVYFPQDVTSRKRIGDFAFKAKGGKHKVAKTKEAVQIDPEVVASIAEFVEMFVTPARCEQGLAAIGGGADRKLTGSFLAWMAADIIKESKIELEVADLEWEQVQKAVSSAVRDWFFAQIV